jgi:antitoxin VapB
MSGYEDRLTRIRALLDEKKLDAIVLRRNPNIAWFIGGRAHGPYHDSRRLPRYCYYSFHNVCRKTNVIESSSLNRRRAPCTDCVLARFLGGMATVSYQRSKLVGSDQLGDIEEISAPRLKFFANLSFAKISSDIDLICADSAVALGDAMKSVYRDDREIDVAGKIAQSLWSHDLELAFLGVAGARRAPLMRHPLPTHDPVGERVVASICAKRKGLIASVTRIVTFGEDASFSRSMRLSCALNRRCSMRLSSGDTFSSGGGSDRLWQEWLRWLGWR